MAKTTKKIMTEPKFYCTTFINCHSWLPEYQPKDCKKQCDDCINIIIDHHRKKTPPIPKEYYDLEKKYGNP